jgi:hypothetical protein
MPIAIEVRLRLPNLTVRSPHEPSRVISNADVRFIKEMEVPMLPRVGDDLALSTRGGYLFAAIVKRVDWHDEKGLFVVECRCAPRAVSLEAYESLRADLDWAARSLL